MLQCIQTLPHHDRLVPELEKAWLECKETFGTENVLIVSNSAGTKNDVGLIQVRSTSDTVIEVTHDLDRQNPYHTI